LYLEGDDGYALKRSAAAGALLARWVLGEYVARVAVNVEEADIEDADAVHGCHREPQRPISPASYSCATERWINAIAVSIAGRENLISVVSSTLAKPSWSRRNAASFRSMTLLSYPPFAGGLAVAECPPTT
jgi:hypothetical protein